MCRATSPRSAPCPASKKHWTETAYARHRRRDRARTFARRPRSYLARRVAWRAAVSRREALLMRETADTTDAATELSAHPCDALLSLWAGRQALAAPANQRAARAFSRRGKVARPSGKAVAERICLSSSVALDANHFHCPLSSHACRLGIFRHVSLSSFSSPRRSACMAGQPLAWLGFVWPRVRTATVCHSRCLLLSSLVSFSLSSSLQTNLHCFGDVMGSAPRTRWAGPERATTQGGCWACRFSQKPMDELAC